MTRHEETKVCASCGRPFANRRKWRLRGQWEQIIYCSERCRRTGRSDRADDGTP